MRLLTLTGQIFFLVLIGCTEETTVNPENATIVVRAYLYADKAVEDVELSTTYSFSSSSYQDTHISDAIVRIISGDDIYSLLPNPDKAGFYYCPDTTLLPVAGQTYSLEIEYSDIIISSSTIVPESPVNLSISDDELTVPDFDDYGYEDRPTFETITFKVTWDNPDREFNYLTIKNIEENPEAIESSFAGFSSNYVSEPVRTDSLRVSVGMVTHLGTHVLNVYRVNQEYADLYEWRNQDTRDLNEAITNIENGFGIFTAFNCESIEFEVVQD